MIFVEREFNGGVSEVNNKERGVSQEIKGRVVSFAHRLDEWGRKFEETGSRETGFTHREMLRGMAVGAGVLMGSTLYVASNLGPELSRAALGEMFKGFTNITPGNLKNGGWHIELLTKSIAARGVEGWRAVSGMIDPATGDVGEAWAKEVVKLTPSQKEIIYKGLEDVARLKAMAVAGNIAVGVGLGFLAGSNACKLEQKVPLSTILVETGRGMSELAALINRSQEEELRHGTN